MRSTMNGPLAHLRRPVLAVTVMLLAASPAPAQESAIDHLRPLMTRDHYTALVDGVQLDKDQQKLAKLLYDDYLAGIDDYRRRVDESANRAGRLQLAEVFAGRIRMTSQELRDMQADVLRVFSACGPEADRLLASFLAGLEGVLREEQKEALPAAVRRLRREVLLHPYQIGENTFTYAGEGVDVMQVVDDARQEGGELVGVDGPGIADTLAGYELRLDRVLQAHGTARRDHEMQLRLAEMLGDEEAKSAHQQQLLSAWRDLYTLNRATVRAIGAVVLETKGDWAQRLWLDRFNRASFTWMYAPRVPDRQLDWIRGNVEATDIIQTAELAYSVYLAERDRLRKEAIDILVEARLDRGVIMNQLTSKRDVEAAAGDLYTAMLRNSGAMSNLDSKHSAEIEALLDTEQRNDMRRAVLIRR